MEKLTGCARWGLRAWLFLKLVRQLLSRKNARISLEGVVIDATGPKLLPLKKSTNDHRPSERGEALESAVFV